MSTDWTNICNEGTCSFLAKTEFKYVKLICLSAHYNIIGPISFPFKNKNAIKTTLISIYQTPWHKSLLDTSNLNLLMGQLLYRTTCKMLLNTDITCAIMYHIILTFSVSNNVCFVSKCTPELRMAIASHIA